MDLQPGNVIDNRYVVEAEIGRGGMAAVYRVRHAQLGTLAALKVLTMPAASIQERLLHEGRVQAALQHPNIVTVSDVVVHNGAPGLVMEYVRGPSLDDFLVKRRMTISQADEIARGVLAGVRAAHTHGLIHRDLKPANIMLAITDSGLIPKVADFGLVKMLEGDGPSMSKTRSGVAMGTPAYMAPEQISDAKNVDYRADIFSLGAILYELVTSVRAFDHDDMFQTFSAIMSANFTPIREYQPELPDRMERAILGALHTDREERIQSVADLLAVWKGEVGADGKVSASESLWDDDFLSEVSSMGAGGETSAESLRRSMKSGMDGLSAHQTAAPHPRDVSNDMETRIPSEVSNTQATMAPIPGMFDKNMPDSAQRAHPGANARANAPADAASATPAAPPAPTAPPTPAEPQAQNSSSAPVAAVAIIGIGLLFAVTGTVLTGAWFSGVFDGNTPTETQTAPDPLPEPVEPDPVPEPTPEPVEVEPTQPDPVPSAPVPDPDPVPDPVPTEPTPQPVEPTPAPVEPVPEPAPEPVPTEPEPVAEPVPEPAPEPVPEPEAPKAPMVYLDTGGVTVRILDVNGRNVPPDRVQAGAKYQIMAVWDAASPAAVVEASQVFEAGKNYQIKCIRSAKRCVIK